MFMRIIIFLCLFCFGGSHLVLAQEETGVQMLAQEIKNLQSVVQLLQSTVSTQNEIIRGLKTRVGDLEQGALKPVAIPQPIVQSSGAPQLTGFSQGFNPDIGMVGSVVGNLTQNKEDIDGNDAIALKELELDISHAVDPFSRADATISFNDAIEEQNVEIEEAYYTRWGLPLGFTGQIGKFRSKIGKQNLLHSHQLETVDYPFVIRDFFGEEGLASSGLRLQNMIPNPWDAPIEITGEIFRGNNGTSFAGVSRRPIFNTHLRTFFDLPYDTNVEVGWTTLFGDENPDTTYIDENGDTVRIAHPEGQTRYGVKIYGADLTVNVPLSEGKKLKWQNELYFQNRTTRVYPNGDPWGFYTLLDYRFSEKYSIGVRFDYVQPLNAMGSPREATAISPYFTFWQSEFADFRVQYTHTEPANSTGKVNNELFLKANFLVGSHKHPVQ